MKIKVKKEQGALLPEYAHAGDAGMDLFVHENMNIPAGERRAIRTGISMEIPTGYELQIRPKSGLALEKGITVLNTPGTIDSGYRGEILVIIFNSCRHDYYVHRGQKIAQGVLARVYHADFEEVSSLDETERGGGGFGSTGI